MVTFLNVVYPFHSVVWSVLGLIADLQNPTIIVVAIETIYGIISLLHVGHGDKAITLTLILLVVMHNIHFLDCAIWLEKLPQETVGSVESNVVHE